MADTDVCSACNNVVFGAATLALDRKYHPRCFKCVVCDSPLSGEFYDVAGTPYCRKDYERRLLPKCGICSKPIESTSVKIHDREGNFYHDTCFVCDKCNGSVVEGYFTVGGRRLCAPCNVSHNIERVPDMQELGHCSSCYKRFAHGEEFQTAQGLKYHPGCIKCNFCKKVINPSRDNYEYEQVTDVVFTFCCQSCVAAGRVDRCAGCSKIIIVNSSTSNFGKSFHTACFKCVRCSRVINVGETFVPKNDTALCAQCAK